MTELAESGRISILNFYERRARRLLPGLLVVMLASLPFAWRYLLPEQLVDFSKSLIFSLFFSSNFYWNYSLQQYGAESALLQPYLHTWSLAVEEQYYIVFPLLLYAIYKWGRQYLAIILSSILALSLLFAQWMTEQDASFSFYMMPTRFWELLAGSLLTLVVLNNYFTVNSKSLWQRAMPSLGLLLITGSLTSFGLEVDHPGFITVIPVVGTLLIIYFKREGDWVTGALSRPSMVYLGLLSYSLYLWHYPIFAFGRMAELAPSLLHKSVWVALTLLLSITSYHLIEKPFRRKEFSRKALALILLLASSTVILICCYWIRGDGFPSRGNYVLDLIEFNRQEIVRNQDGRNCLAGLESEFGISESCIFEYFPGSPTLILVGDSHAASLAASVKALAIENHLNFVQVTHIGCPHVTGVKKWCGQRGEAMRSYLKNFQSPIIVYSARLPLYIEREPYISQEAQGSSGETLASRRDTMHRRFSDHVSKDVVTTLASWVNDGYELVIVYPVPEQGFHVSSLLSSFSRSISGVDQMPTISTSYDAYMKRVASSYLALDKVIGSRVRRVYPEKIFCRQDAGRCIAAESDRIYFLVDNHVAALGADLIVREVAAELELQIPDSFRK